IIPVANANGSDTITLTLTDSGGLTTAQDISVTINPVNDAPDTPFGNTPAAGGSDIAVDADLSWSGGDPDVGDSVTYDVYFGSDNPPTALVSDDQTELTYDPGTLDYNTTYYWKIVARDNHGAETSGPVWSFTTTAMPLRLPVVTTETVTGIGQNTATSHGKISDPGNPVASAHGFCWNTGGTPTTSDAKIDLGTASAGAFNAELAGLVEDTTYYVRAYASNSVGTVYGNEGLFKTGKPVEQIWYRDYDEDGYGDSEDSVLAADQPEGYVANDYDFDDSDNTVYPGAPELCDGKDNDQDEAIDEDCSYGTVFVSNDGLCNGYSPCYDTIADGYLASADNGEIKVKAGFYLEELALARDISVNLSGGWDSDYSENAEGQSSISGCLTISRGTVTVENLIIEGKTYLSQVETTHFAAWLHESHRGLEGYTEIK
ncbi:MAG: hypothetical protein JXQ81_03625, partial [Desulfuromonadales bacterium]|nr:hypothetical protein [Desulfuromonadales bacterium]